jgi:hypothetical protein
MTCAASDRQRIQWMWKSNVNPFSLTEPDEWNTYSDVETRMIEEAFQKKQTEALLDGYHINFKQLVQISNNNMEKQRLVKRVVNEHAETRLREERFMPSSFLPSSPFGDGDLYLSAFVRATVKHFKVSTYIDENLPFNHDLVRQMMVEKAAEGLILEGKKAGKQKEGEWMARQLLCAKNKTQEVIWKRCAQLYCMESFLYKKMNEVMRLVGEKEHEALWKSKVPTFGPFAFLLSILKKNREELGKSIIVYRGANLSDDHIDKYKNARMWLTGTYQTSITYNFPAFTSTSQNQRKAEEFGNVLFIITLNPDDGCDVSPYSEYDEEEVLLHPNFKYCIKSCTFDAMKQKWIINLVPPPRWTTTTT